MSRLVAEEKLASKLAVTPVSLDGTDSMARQGRQVRLVAEERLTSDLQS